MKPPRRNIAGIAIPMICIVAALLVIGGVLWHRGQQRKQAEWRRIIAAQKAEEEARQQEQEEEARKAEADRKTKVAAIEICVEAKVQQGKVERISDADGFKARKEQLTDVLNRADAFYDENVKRWDDAAALYKSYVEQSKSLIALDEQRQRAVAKKGEVKVSFKKAEEAGAKTYARDSWNAAVKTWDAADAEFRRMEFASAAETFAKALKEFDGCADEAKDKRRIAEETREVITGGPFNQDPSYERCMDVDFQPVYFPKDIGDRQLVPSERSKVNVVAQHLLNNPDRAVIVMGHCDESVSSEFGLSLSEHYACMIRDALVSAGINGERIQTRGYGTEKPAVIGSDERTSGMNNRVEFEIIRRKTSQKASEEEHYRDGDFAGLSPTDMAYLLFKASAQNDVALVAKVACTETFKLLTVEQLKNNYVQFKPESQDSRIFLGEIMKVASITQHIVDENNAKVEIFASKEKVENAMLLIRDRDRIKGRIAKQPSEIRMVFGCKKMDGRWRVAAFPD